MTQVIGRKLGDIYRCECCGDVFPVDQTEAEMEAEYAANGFDQGDERATVCDDCYADFMAWYRGLGGPGLRH